MKRVLFIVSFWTVLQFATPAFSYIEVTERGDTEATAGEQNTNLYRLNAQGISAIKKLKKVDDILARGQSAGKVFAKTDINDLLESDAKQQEKQELSRLSKELDKKLGNPKNLKTNRDASTYAQIRELKSDMRDVTIAQNLRAEFGRLF